MVLPAEWIEIGDFSRGIIADKHGYQGSMSGASDSNAAFSGLGLVGAATAAGTYGCTADATGALVPLPAGTTSDTRSNAAFASGSNTGTTYTPANRAYAFLLDAALIPAIYAGPTPVTPTTKAFLMFGAYYDYAAGSSYKQLVWGALAGVSSGDTDWSTIHWNHYDPGVTLDGYGPYAIPSGNAMLTRSVDGTRDADDVLSYGLTDTQNSLVFMFHSNPNSFNDENTSWASGAIPGGQTALTDYDATVSTNFPVSADSAASACIGTWPDPLAVAAGTSNAVTRYISEIPGFLAIAHQGRIVIASHASRRFGNVDQDLYSLIDRLYYSPVYNPSLCTALTSPSTTYGPPSYETSIAGDENVAPIGVMASLTASELLIVKWANGGVLMRGDMDNFEATSLPFIEPTYGIRHHGCGTPFGYCYGSRNGIFIWPHGSETTEKISEQLPGFFWNHAVLSASAGTEVPYVGNRGRFAYWNGMICVPNNYVYNAMHKSWWRLDTTSSSGLEAYNVYQVDPATGKLLAFPWRVAFGTSYKWKSYDQDTLRSTYKWTSQPIAETRDVEYSIKGCEITFTMAEPFSGGGTITVTVSSFGYAGQPADTDRVFTFTPEAYQTQVMYLDALNSTAGSQGTVQAKYLQVTIETAGGTGPAPKVHKVRIGVSPRVRSPRPA